MHNVNVYYFVIFGLLVSIFAQIYQYDPDLSIGRDFRPNSMRVRNEAGAQVGYLGYPGMKFHQANLSTYVMRCYNVSALTGLYKDVYTTYGIAFKEINDTQESYTVIDHTFVEYISPGMLVIRFGVDKYGIYAPVFIRPDYQSVAACVEDVCLRCNGDNTTCKDCEGTVFGAKYVDSCGVCGGMNKDKDCDGVCFGNNTADPVTRKCPS